MKARQKPGVVFQPHVHQALKRGIHTMVAAIRPTLGPLGGGIAIDRMNSAKKTPELLDDGGVIARRVIEVTNRDEDMGAMLVRSMVARQHERVGDGTATTAVLFEAVFDAGLRYTAAGGNTMQLRRYLEAAIPLITAEIDQMVVPLEGQQRLTEVALALCHDRDMAALMGEAFEVLGEYGRLEIREDQKRGYRSEFVEGSYFYSGLFSRVLLPEGSPLTVTLENPAIFLCDFEVEDHQDLFPVLHLANQQDVPGLVIVTRSLSEKATSLLVAHNNMGKFRVMAVKLPGGTPTERMHYLDDLSALTGATPLLTATGDTTQQVTADHFGRARRVWADSRVFGVVSGRGNPRTLRAHLDRLKQFYQHAQDTDERKKALERIGNLMGSSVTLWVGGFTEPEISIRKSVAERTALTLRAAIQGGVVPGGGIALLNCRPAIRQQLGAATDPDQRAAWLALLDALEAPARAIFRNAGHDPGSVMARLSYERPGTGFDVVTNRVVDACDAGLLDSAQVLKASVINAISTAALALTVDSLVHVAKPDIERKP